MNDSLVGPFAPIDHLLDRFHRSRADVWGMTDTEQLGHHLQSYCLGFRKGCLDHPELRAFWRGIRVEASRDDVIHRYELGLSRVLRHAKLSTEAAIEGWRAVDGDDNPTLIGWRRLLDLGFPFVKRQVLLDPGVCPDGHLVRDELRRRFRHRRGRVAVSGGGPEHVTRLERARRRVRKAVRQALRPDRPAGDLASPAAYESWLARTPSAGQGFPEEWLAHPDLPFRSGARIAAVVHVYYPELLDELVGHLASITVPFDLLVTNASGRHLALDTARMPQVAGQRRPRCREPRSRPVAARPARQRRADRRLRAGRQGPHEAKRLACVACTALAGTGGSWRSDLLAAILG